MVVYHSIGIIHIQPPKLAMISHFAPCTFTFAKLPLELGNNLMFKHLSGDWAKKYLRVLLLSLTQITHGSHLSKS